MKDCQKCGRTYEDDTLNFCLDDGTVLLQSNSPVIEPPDTVEFPKAKQTEVNYPLGTEQNRFNQPSLQNNVQKKSKSWLWVLGILMGVMLICGGGIAGLAIIGVMSEPEDGRQVIKSSDFSDWKFDSNQYIKAENNDGKLVLTSIKDYYYIFVFKEYSTYDASINLTVENATGNAAKFGYGLVVHGHPTKILSQGYAFLIDSNTGKYRVVQHIDQNETELVEWTTTSAINKGSQSNDLEVRTNGNMMEFIINNVSVRTIEDKEKYRDGVAGVYTSDENPITFTNLELRK